MKGDPVALEKPQPRQRTLRVQLPEPLYDWLMAQHSQLGISAEALVVDMITAYRLQDDVHAIGPRHRRRTRERSGQD